MEEDLQPGEAGAETIGSGVIAEARLEGGKVACRFANGSSIFVSAFLAAQIGTGDEINFPLSINSEGAGTELYLRKKSSTERPRDLYQAPILYAAQPKADKRGQLYVRAQSPRAGWAFPQCIYIARLFGITSASPTVTNPGATKRASMTVCRPLRRPRLLS